VLEWIFGLLLVSLYIFFIFTICRLTFAKGYTLFGILGIFIPFLWLIGAILPAKPGSAQDRLDAQRYRAQMNEATR
jgi:hypothetical protein